MVVMAPIDGYWNGDKSGAVGHYPWRENQKVEDGRSIPSPGHCT